MAEEEDDKQALMEEAVEVEMEEAVEVETEEKEEDDQHAPVKEIEEAVEAVCGDDKMDEEIDDSESSKGKKKEKRKSKALSATASPSTPGNKKRRLPIYDSSLSMAANACKDGNQDDTSSQVKESSEVGDLELQDLTTIFELWLNIIDDNDRWFARK